MVRTLEEAAAQSAARVSAPVGPSSVSASAPSVGTAAARSKARAESNFSTEPYIEVKDKSGKVVRVPESQWTAQMRASYDASGGETVRLGNVTYGTPPSSAPNKPLPPRGPESVIDGNGRSFMTQTDSGQVTSSSPHKNIIESIHPSERRYGASGRWDALTGWRQSSSADDVREAAKVASGIPPNYPAPKSVFVRETKEGKEFGIVPLGSTALSYPQFLAETRERADLETDIKERIKAEGPVEGAARRFFTTFSPYGAEYVGAVASETFGLPTKRSSKDISIATEYSVRSGETDLVGYVKGSYTDSLPGIFATSMATGAVFGGATGLLSTAASGAGTAAKVAGVSLKAFKLAGVVGGGIYAGGKAYETYSAVSSEDYGRAIAGLSTAGVGLAGGYIGYQSGKDFVRPQKTTQLVSKSRQSGTGVIDEKTGKFTYKSTTIGDDSAFVSRGSATGNGNRILGSDFSIGVNKEGNVLFGKSYQFGVSTGQGISKGLQIWDLATIKKSSSILAKLHLKPRFEVDTSSGLSFGGSRTRGEPLVISEWKSGDREFIDVITTGEYGGVSFSGGDLKPYQGTYEFVITQPSLSSGGGGRVTQLPPPFTGGFGGGESGFVDLGDKGISLSAGPFDSIFMESKDYGAIATSQEADSGAREVLESSSSMISGLGSFRDVMTRKDSGSAMTVAPTTESATKPSMRSETKIKVNYRTGLLGSVGRADGLESSQKISQGTSTQTAQQVSLLTSQQTQQQTHTQLQTQLKTAQQTQTQQRLNLLSSTSEFILLAPPPTQKGRPKKHKYGLRLFRKRKMKRGRSKVYIVPKADWLSIIQEESRTGKKAKHPPIIELTEKEYKRRLLGPKASILRFPTALGLREMGVLGKKPKKTKKKRLRLFK